MTILAIHCRFLRSQNLFASAKKAFKSPPQLVFTKTNDGKKCAFQKHRTVYLIVCTTKHAKYRRIV